MLQYLVKDIMQKKNFLFIEINHPLMHQLAVALHHLGHDITVSYAKKTPLAIKDFFIQKDLCIAIDSIQALKNVLKKDTIVITPQDIDNTTITSLYSYIKRNTIPSSDYYQYLKQCFKHKQHIVFLGEKKKMMCALTKHILQYYTRNFDYIIYESDLSVKFALSDAPIVLVQEPMVMPIKDKIVYKHHIGVISTFSPSADEKFTKEYVQEFVQASPKGGTLIYCKQDALVNTIASVPPREDIKKIPYVMVESPLDEHVQGVRFLLENIGITSDAFEKALPSFIHNKNL